LLLFDRVLPCALCAEIDLAPGEGQKLLGLDSETGVRKICEKFFKWGHKSATGEAIKAATERSVYGFKTGGSANMLMRVLWAG
jgi:hypothetical protein